MAKSNSRLKNLSKLRFIRKYKNNKKYKVKNIKVA